MKKTSINLAALGAAACSAPGVSVIVALLIAFAASVIDGSFATGDILTVIGSALLLAVIVSAWGLIPAMLFGAAGAFLAGCCLPVRPAWPWGVAGAATAGVYLLTSIGLGHVAPSIAFCIAPWVLLLKIGGPGGRGAEDGASRALIMCSIVLAGAIAGLVYRHLLTRRSVVWRTYDPLAAHNTDSGAGGI